MLINLAIWYLRKRNVSVLINFKVYPNSKFESTSERVSICDNVFLEESE